MALAHEPLVNPSLFRFRPAREYLTQRAITGAGQARTVRVIWMVEREVAVKAAR